MDKPTEDTHDQPELQPNPRILRVNAMTEAEILELLRCDEVLEPEDDSPVTDNHI